MTEVLPDFRLHNPVTVDEAVKAYEAAENPRYCAGGTDMLVNMRRGLVKTDTVIDLTKLAEMKRFEEDSLGLYLGAGLTLRQLSEETAIADSYPAIVHAAMNIAGPSHREAATLGGNLCLDTRCQYYNQSHWWRQSNDFCLKYKGDICHVAPTGNRCRAAFSGDLAPTLMVHDAEIDIIGPKGSRRVMLKDFYHEDGADHLLLKDGEIVLGVHLPATNVTSAYEKIRIRGAMDFPLAGVAIAYNKGEQGSNQFKIAITGTNSCPLTVNVPDFNPNEFGPNEYFELLEKLVQKSVSPQRTTVTAAHYRRLSVAAVASRLARKLWED